MKLPEHNPFKFDGTISLGHLLLILTLIISVVAAWTANRERSLSNGRAVEQLQTELKGLETRIREIETRNAEH